MEDRQLVWSSPSLESALARHSGGADCFPPPPPHADVAADARVRYARRMVPDPGEWGGDHRWCHTWAVRGLGDMPWD